MSSRTIDYNNFGWESWEMGWTARSIFLGQGFSSPFLAITGPTALVPPLYPYLLAGGFHLFGLNTVKVAFAVLSLNGFFSALTCIPLYFLVLHALTRRLARIAALAWAVYPFAIYFSADRVWDYALTALLFTTCLVVAQRLHTLSLWAWLGFGALYGLTVLSNPSVVSLLPFLLLIAMYRAAQAGRRWFAPALLATLGFFAVCTPWNVRNHRVMHADFFIRDGFWLEFYAGNNGDSHESNSAIAHPASNPAEMRRYQAEGEIRYMAEKRALAISFVKHHPGFFAVATARRVVRFWTGYWSFRPAYLKYEPFDLPNVPFCLVLSFFTFRGLRRWWREDREAALPYALAVLIFPLPYYLTHASMDYRQPLEPIVIVLVTVGVFGTGLRREPGPAHSAPKPSRSPRPCSPEHRLRLCGQLTELLHTGRALLTTLGSEEIHPRMTSSTLQDPTLTADADTAASMTAGQLAALKIKQDLRMGREHQEGRINWITSIFMGLFHVGAIAALFFFSWKNLAAGVIMYFLAINVGIGMCYHRLLTHRGYRVPKWLEYFLTACGTMALEGGPIFWVATHRVHHQNSDQEGDPHSPHDGTWWAHAGWILSGRALHSETALLGRYAPDLSRDRGQVWLSRFHWLPMTVCGVLQVIIGASLAPSGHRIVGALGMVLWGTFLRTSLGLHATWLVNSATHLWGARRFETKDDSRNSWWVALLTGGEGWHNNHHAHPVSARHGFVWYEFDINYYGIWLMERLGLAKRVQVAKWDPSNPKPAGVH